MKKKLLSLGAFLFLMGCAAQEIIVSKKDRSHFSVEGQIVMYDKQPLARYQAKTYSLDGGELVEEYNLLLLDNQIKNKQLIGDLIDFVSERHQGAEVEIEINSEKSIFEL